MFACLLSPHVIQFARKESMFFPHDSTFLTVLVYGVAAFAYMPDEQLVDPHRSKNNTSWEGIEGKPFGFSSFPKETTLPPRAWLDAIGKLTWYKENPQVCSHFLEAKYGNVGTADSRV